MDPIWIWYRDEKCLQVNLMWKHTKTLVYWTKLLCLRYILSWEMDPFYVKINLSEGGYKSSLIFTHLVKKKISNCNNMTNMSWQFLQVNFYFFLQIQRSIYCNLLPKLELFSYLLYLYKMSKSASLCKLYSSELSLNFKLILCVPFEHMFSSSK